MMIYRYIDITMKEKKIIARIANGISIVGYVLHFHVYVTRAEVEEFFANMDRDFDGKLSFAEFMGEETPLEKVG